MYLGRHNTFDFADVYRWKKTREIVDLAFGEKFAEDRGYLRETSFFNGNGVDDEGKGVVGHYDFCGIPMDDN